MAILDRLLTGFSRLLIVLGILALTVVFIWLISYGLYTMPVIRDTIIVVGVIGFVWFLGD